MKKGIHPEYQEAIVKCVCGNEFKTRSTLKEINVEICSACHPFFTGQQKLVDSAGRVDRFIRKYGKDYAAGAAKEEASAESGGDAEAGHEGGPPPADAETASPEAAEKPAPATEGSESAQAEGQAEPDDAAQDSGGPEAKPGT